jgi:hypothetical protein
MTEADGQRRYRYVGPSEIRSAALAAPAGVRITSAGDFERWAASVDTADFADPFTYVVDVDGVLRLAPRRSEHVACAAGGDVLAAGEIAFEHDRQGWLVSQVSNQSTGFCPEVASWSAVASALDLAGLRRPAGFTFAVEFRRCGRCARLNLVKDDDYTCQVCGEALPVRWNVDHVNVESK